MEAQQRGSGVWTLRAVKVVAYFTSCLRNFLLVASFVRSRVPRPSHGIKFNACSQRINNSLIEQSRQSVRVRKLRTELKTLRNFFSNSESYIFRLPLFLFLPLLHRLIISCATLFVAIWRDSADLELDLEKSFGRFVDRSIVSSLLKNFSSILMQRYIVVTFNVSLHGKIFSKHTREIIRSKYFEIARGLILKANNFIYRSGSR